MSKVITIQDGNLVFSMADSEGAVDIDVQDGNINIGRNALFTGTVNIGLSAASFNSIDIKGNTIDIGSDGGTVIVGAQSGTGDVALYNDAESVFVTTTQALGGVFVNNTLTGSGSERVLTTSDTAGGATVIAHYRFNTTLTEADPGNGTFRMDNATPASVTEIYVSSTTDGGNDFDNMLGFLSSGDQVYIQQDNDATRFVLLDVTVNVDNTGWYSIAVTVNASGSLFGSNSKCSILLLFGGTGSGASNVVKTGSPVNNQLAIWTDGNTIEGDTNLQWDGTNLALTGTTHIVLPQTDDSATPSLAFGDGDTGFYETGDDTLATSTGTVEANRLTAAIVQTTDATVTEIIGIPVASGEGFGFEIHVMGTQDSTGDTVFERVFGAIRNQGGTTALVGSTLADRTDDAGASTWTITVAADNTPDELTVDVTGEAAHTIDWKVRVHLLNV